MSVATQVNSMKGLSEAARSALNEQLERMLASPYFSHSRRFPSFLRFVVEHTVAGDAEDIKERTMGIEIFGREADYDTAADPIVRVTAAEIRKRLAQYYLDPAHNDELRITLPSGSYVPQFHSPRGINIDGFPEMDAVAAELPDSAPRPAAQTSRHWLLGALLIVMLACILAGGAYLYWQWTKQSAFDYFWGPVLSSNEPVLLCVADQLDYSAITLRDASDPARQLTLKDSLTAVVIDDLNATIKVAGILQSSGKSYSLKGEGATTLDDLRRGPAVFVGAFDNAWTLRLTNPLRYRFANDPGMMHFWIVDSKTPGQPRWVVDRGIQMATNNYRDYAILARFTDPNTGKLAVVVAGVSRGGTRAVGEFLSDNTYLTQLMRAARAAGDKKNMEVVLSTQIIDGEPGTPTMEASYFW